MDEIARAVSSNNASYRSTSVPIAPGRLPTKAAKKSADYGPIRETYKLATKPEKVAPAKSVVVRNDKIYICPTPNLPGGKFTPAMRRWCEDRRLVITVQRFWIDSSMSSREVDDRLQE